MADATGLSWQVTPPGASKPVAIPAGGALEIPCGGLKALAVRSRSAARGGSAGMFLLALPAAEAADAPGVAGDWGLSLGVAPGAVPLEVRAFVARSQSELGALERHQPSRLIDPTYDRERFLRASLQDSARIGNKAPRTGMHVRREGTASALTAAARDSDAGGTGVTAVAGARLRPKLGAADYSGAGLLPSRSVSGISDESRELRGIRGAGTRSGCVLRLRGTSFAAPQWARELADQRAKGYPLVAPDPLDPPDGQSEVPKADEKRLGRRFVLPAPGST